MSPSDAMKASYAKRVAAMIRKYIDPGFGDEPERELTAIQGSRKPGHRHAVSLSYFDAPAKALAAGR